MIVVDASVAVKWTVAEADRDKAMRVLDRAHELMAPDLLLAEAANVLHRKSRLGEVSVRQSETALRAYEARFLGLYHRSIWLTTHRCLT